MIFKKQGGRTFFDSRNPKFMGNKLEIKEKIETFGSIRNIGSMPQNLFNSYFRLG